MPYRILDLTCGECDFCGKILADMGADVIKVEPPGGSPGRNIGPFIDGIPDPQKSLYWFVYNANKRGITLNLDSNEGRNIFNELVKTAQVIIESFPPEHGLKGYLSYAALGKLNPGIITTSITPFGLTGPYRNYAATDLVGMAMGGALYLTGDEDLPPVSVSFPQAYLYASAQAAVATLIAIWHLELSGQGQQVDVSMQESVAAFTQAAVPYWELYSQILSRAGSYRVGVSTSAKLRQIWKCKDGYIAFLVFGGSTGEKSNRMLIEWVDSEGMADDFLRKIDPAFDVGASGQDFHDHLDQILQRFFLAHTKEQLYQEALKRKIMMYPVSSIKDLMESPQLKARDYWEEIACPEAGFAGKTSILPGAFAKLSNTPWKNRCRAPIMGEHNLEIYRELGLSEDDVDRLKIEDII